MGTQILGDVRYLSCRGIRKVRIVTFCFLSAAFCVLALHYTWLIVDRYLSREVYSSRGSYINRAMRSRAWTGSTNLPSGGELLRVPRVTRVAWITGMSKMSVDFLSAAMMPLWYDTVAGDKEPKEWDVLLTFKHLKKDLVLNLQPWQKVHYSPGHIALDVKGSLYRANISVIQPVFRLPTQRQQFIKFVRENKNTMWVRKNPRKGGVKIVEPSGMMDETDEVDVQKYVANPLLIDNRKFDIAVYMAVTSVIPMTLYVYYIDWQLKFHAAPYLPFNASDTTKYVERNDFYCVYEMPSLRSNYLQTGQNQKQSLLDFIMRTTGVGAEEVVSKIMAAMTEVGAKSDVKMAAEATMETNITDFSHFFRLMRFDIILDNDLQPWVFEISGNPRFPDRRCPKRGNFFMDVFSSMTRLVGLSEQSHRLDPLELLSNDSINVDSEVCSTSTCDRNCQKWVCRTCDRCLTRSDRKDLRNAALCHFRRGPWSRIVPPPFRVG